MADVKQLIVDHESSMRSALQRALRRHDYRITTSSDGTEAVSIPELPSQDTFAVAFVGLCMPCTHDHIMLTDKNQHCRMLITIITARY